MNKFFTLVILLFVTATTNTASAINTLYYWRSYDGVQIPIPPDAVRTESDTIFVAQATNANLTYGGTLDSQKGTATINSFALKVTVLKNIKILCTAQPERLRWEWVNIKTLQGAFLGKLVVGGNSAGVNTFIGKVFHENEWKISKVFPYEHEYKGLLIWSNENSKEFRVYDFQILMFD